MITSFPSPGWRSERIARVRRRTVASARLRAGRAVSEAIPRRRARTRDRTRRSSPRTSARIERARPLHSQARRGPSATAEVGTVAVASSLLTDEPLAASGLHGARPLCSARACAASPRKDRAEPLAMPDKLSKLPKWRTGSASQDNTRSTRTTRRVPPQRSGYNLLRPCNGVAKRVFARHAGPRRSPPARPEVNMRKLATAVAVAFAALSAQAALACDEKVERAEQPQHKPA